MTSKRQDRLNIGCWNLRTLVETEGRLATSLARPGSRGVPVDRKATMMVHELRKYKLKLVAISETKWFGQDVYNIEGYTILHSGCSVPRSGEAVDRNEGVGIVLDPCTTEAWRHAGEVWKAVSPRLVLTRLKLGGSSGSPPYATVVSAYAPTHRSSQEKKDEFYTDLQSTLDGVNKDDVLLLLGNFNARVGKSERHDGGSDWTGVRGYHGVGNMNESGEALLTFCALNGLAIMNTTFEKKEVYMYTWQHPGSKQWHCIDYVIMRQSQRKLCCDVTVLRSAECWTDHKLVRVQLKLRAAVKAATSAPKVRFAVSELKEESKRNEFNMMVCDGEIERGET